MKPHLTLLFASMMMGLLVGCASDDTTVAATFEAQVAAAVAATVNLIPTATPMPSLTPYPTLTPEPTLTPAPTLTARPSLTPDPTYTPYPTATSTPTSTPLPTAIPAVSVTPVSQASPSPAGDTRALILQTAERALNHIDRMTNLIRGGYRQIDYNPFGPSFEAVPVDCVAFLDAYDKFVNVAVFDVSGSDPAVQNGYNIYQAAVAVVSQSTDGDLTSWISACRTAISQGVTGLYVEGRARGMDPIFIQARDLLHAAINGLR